MSVWQSVLACCVGAMCCALIFAGAAKLLRPAQLAHALDSLRPGEHSRAARCIGAAEVLAGGLALVAPVRAGGALVAALFSSFALALLALTRSGFRGSCGCFGERRRQAPPRGESAALNLLCAATAAAAAASGARAPLLAFHSRPLAAAVPVLLLLSWRALWSVRGGRAGSGRARAPAPLGAARGIADGIGERLVSGSAAALERRFSRRSALVRLAWAGSALCMAPLRYLLYPLPASAVVVPDACSQGLCTDGYTAFCCEINQGLNQCPRGTFPGGWWMCTDYVGRRLCREHGVRYYIDCNALPQREFPGGCRCAKGSCEHRRVACNVFRYGQCNPQIGGVTAVVCRMVTCRIPSSIPDLNCASSLMVDDAVCAHEARCLEPPAVALPGAGGA